MNQDRQKVITVVSNARSRLQSVPVLASMDASVQYLQSRIQNLLTIIDDLVTRPEEDAADEIEQVLRALSAQDASLRPQLVKDNFDYNFFRDEPDVAYKKKLAAAIVNYMREVSPSYKNDFLSGISDGSTTFKELITPITEEL